MNNNEFDKFARMHQGISSTTLSRYQSTVDAYINPSIIEERKLNVAQLLFLASVDPKAENHEKKHHGRYLRREFSYEKFQQMLTLPEDAEADKIEAKVEHGVLNVHIPKKEKVDVQKAVRQIEIQ